jgi:hypothetical protein
VRHEPVAAPSIGADGHPRIRPDLAAEQRHLRLERVVGHDRAGPGAAQQRLLRHQRAIGLGEGEQHLPRDGQNPEPADPALRPDHVDSIPTPWTPEDFTEFQVGARDFSGRLRAW